MKKIAVLILCLALLKKSNAQIVINEYSASNNSLIADYQGDFEDFVELFNPTASPINLINYFLSDDAANLSKWVINQNINVPANGRIVLFCSGKGLITPGGQIHTDFKLTQCKNDKIIISTPAGAVLDSLTMVRTQLNHSRGRITDGNATWGLFTTPNPNAPNSGALTDYATKPVFSLAPGFYTGAQSISLFSPDPNVTIRYTLNGTLPTALSTAYTTPISVSNTMVVRAVAFSSNAQIAPSFVETNSYFINVSHTMPVVSLTGTYTNGLFNNSSNQINSSFEFFDSLKNFKWEFNGYTRRHGHDSWAFPQKGFRVYADDKQGYLHQMDEKFFANSNRTKFPMVILKAGASDNYPGNTNRSYAHMRDAYCQTYSIKNNLNLDERSYCPAIVYINGNYWGVYEIRERVDDDFTDHYFNQGSNNIDMLQMWGGLTVTNGVSTGWTTLYNFITNNNMALPANYKIVDSQLNMLSLIDYMVINTVGVNSDWLNWNTKWWRGNKGNGVKWRYTLWDMDNTFGLGENYTGLPTTTANADPCATFDLGSSLNGAFQGHVDITNSLMTNPTFNALFKNRYAYLMSEVFVCDSMLAHLEYFRNLLKPEMTAHVARWGGTVAKWEQNVDSVKRFILKRCTLIGGAGDTCLSLKQLTVNVDPIPGGKVKLDGTTVAYYPKRYTLATDSLLNLIALPSTGYLFKEWKYFSAGNVLTPDVLEDTIQFKLTVIDSIVAVFEIDYPDTFNVVINAISPSGATVVFDGVNITTFPTVLRLVENTNHTLSAKADAKHKFLNWGHYNNFDNSINPNSIDSNINYIFVKNLDTLTAFFDTVIIIDTPKTVITPNAFSPNQIPPNNYFGAFTSYNKFITSATIKVYNRIGNKVYDGDGMVSQDASGNFTHRGWDGKTNNGEDCAADTYFYVMRVVYADNSTKTFKGEVFLLR